MGCTTYSFITFLVLGIAALLLIVGMATDAIVVISRGNRHRSSGLFDGKADWWKATQAMMIIGIIAMAAAGVFFLLGLFMKNMSRKIIKVLQIAAIFGAVGAITLGLIIFGSKFRSTASPGYLNTLGYSCYLILVSDVLTVAAGVVSVMDMRRGE